MAIPLTITIILLALMIFALGYVVWRLTRQMAVNADRSVQRMADYMAATSKLNTAHEASMKALLDSVLERSDAAMKMAAKATSDAPKYADKVSDALTRSIQQVTAGIADGMKSVYAPAQQESPSQPQSGFGDVLTPWYGGQNRGMDYSDPTDHIQSVRADGADYQGAVIEADDAEPFGIPGLGIDPARLPDGSINVDQPDLPPPLHEDAQSLGVH